MSKADKTRQYIIESCAELFNKKGYAGTSLADITEITGLTKGSIYGNFENKDEVAKEVFRYNVKRLQNDLDNQIDSNMSTREQLISIVNFYKTNWTHNFSRGGCPMMNTAIECDDTFPILKNEVAKSFSGWSNKIAKTIENGKLNNEIKASVNSSEYAYLFIVLIEGGILLSKTTNNQNHLFNALDRITKIIDTELTQ